MTEEKEKTILHVEHLTSQYQTDGGIVHAVNDISFSLKEGETIGLVGETGAGKTTSALSILGLLPERTGKVVEGEIFFQGSDLLKKTQAEMRLVRGALISMIFQDPMTALNPIFNVGDQILESLQIHNTEEQSRGELGKKVDELLSLVGISPNRKKEYPHQFSGGMKQRIVIAIALACQPQLIIADEPTTALDVTIQAQVLALMEELKQRLGTSMIMITHDLGIVAEVCDKVAILYAGEIVEQGTVEDLFTDRFHHPYTEGLFGALPDLSGQSERLKPIAGLMPDPMHLPTGCAFHPRCPKKIDRCDKEHPDAIEVQGHMIRCHLFEKGGC